MGDGGHDRVAVPPFSDPQEIFPRGSCCSFNSDRCTVAPPRAATEMWTLGVERGGTWWNIQSPVGLVYEGSSSPLYEAKMFGPPKAVLLNRVESGSISSLGHPVILSGSVERRIIQAGKGKSGILGL